MGSRQRARGRDAVVRRLELADADRDSVGSGQPSSPGAGPPSLASAVPASLMAVAAGNYGGLPAGALPDRLPPAAQITSARCARAAAPREGIPGFLADDKF